MPWKNKEKSSQSPSLHKQAIPQHPLFLFPQRPVEGRAGAYFDFECFLLKNGALYFITQQKKSFFSEIFNVVRLMDEKQTKYAPALVIEQRHVVFYQLLIVIGLKAAKGA